MEVGPHRGTRGGKGPRARLYNTLQQIVVDEYKRQNRRFRWIRFADASKQQVEALFSWRESLDSWHLWNFDQEAFDVIQAADTLISSVSHWLKPQEWSCRRVRHLRIKPQPQARREHQAVQRTGFVLRRLHQLPPGCKIRALLCLAFGHLQRKDKPQSQLFAGYTLKLRKRGGRAAGNGQHRDRGPHRHEGRGLHQHHRDEDQLLLPLWNKGLIVLNPRLRVREGHPRLP